MIKAIQHIFGRSTAALVSMFVALCLLGVTETAEANHFTGEMFVGTNLNVKGTCKSGPAQHFEWNFQVSGMATGPYPGKFEETGHIGGADISRFTATFQVTSGDQIITGTKEGVVGWGCTSDNQFFSFSGFVRYTITSPFQDSGFGTVKGLWDPAVGVTVFNETFIASEQHAPAAILLSPLADVNPVGTFHTVTATVVDAFGQPVGGVRVFFTVEGSVTTTGNCLTGSDGTCTFTYRGPDLPGADVITASSGAAIPGKATKVWALPASTPGQVTGGGSILHGNIIDGVSFGFNAQNTDRGFHGQGNVIDHQTGTKIHILDVTALVVVGRHATFFGNATVDGVETTYRIDVDDLGDSGRFDVFKIQTDSGYMAGGFLTGGNIQIHK